MKELGETKGLLAGKFPYVRFGNAPRKLVVFPGLADSVLDVTGGSATSLFRSGKIAQEFTVYLISRKRGLPRGCTTAAMAADYAEAFEKEIGPAAVLGISLGGHIAQHFAANYPQYVQQLVIACSAHQVSREGRLIPERWLALAGQRHWRKFCMDIVQVTRHEYQHAFRQFLLPWRHLNYAHPSDFLYSLEASLNHDGSSLLDRIQCPTLVVGGSQDVFFPPNRLQEMVRRIAHATLLLLDGGHAAYTVRRIEFETAVLDFLLGKPLAAPNLREVALPPAAAALAAT